MCLTVALKSGDLSIQLELETSAQVRQYFIFDHFFLFGYEESITVTTQYLYPTL